MKMTNEELMEQMITVMQQQTDTLVETMDQKIRDVKIFIENDVGKRIDSLFDGYKLSHEKQWELQHETERLKEQVNDLQMRLSVLEKKISA